MADDIQVRFGASIGELISGVEAVKESILSIAEPVIAAKEALAGLSEGIAAAFGVEKLAGLFEGMAELGERTERSMAILGQSAKQVGELDFVAKATGTSADSLAHAMERFAIGLQHAQSGAGPVAEALHTISISE
jgi:hypothetical protein